MKKILTFIIVLTITFILFMIIVKNFEKEKWYVEITNEYINIRSESGTYSKILGQAKKGETYTVLDIKTDDSKYYWYYIKIDNYKNGWIASDKQYAYLIDYNNPKDITAPVVKYYEETYYAKSIKDINYKHLEIKEDSEYKVSSKIYYEKENNQYWIDYKVVDGNKNTTNKIQKIKFEIEPKQNEVKLFEERNNKQNEK